MSEVRNTTTIRAGAEELFCLASAFPGHRVEDILAKLPELEVLSGRSDGKTGLETNMNLGLARVGDRDARELSRPPLKWGINE